MSCQHFCSYSPAPSISLACSCSVGALVSSANPDFTVRLTGSSPRHPPTPPTQLSVTLRPQGFRKGELSPEAIQQNFDQMFSV